MTISTSYTVGCNGCGTDTGSSRPTEAEAIDRARRGDWIVYTLGPNKDGHLYGYALCLDCRYKEEDKSHDPQ